MSDADETIVAIASPASPAVRGIVRMSGPNVVSILKSIFGATSWSATRPSRTTLSLDLGRPIGLAEADLMLWPTRRSYTGEPSAEIHTLGSMPILGRIVDRLLAAGGRAARPGEFTMRAFLAGRLDLTQAEAVLGVIDAEGRGALDHALQQLAGNLSRPIEAIRSTLLDLLADVEAGLDFVDEDIEFVTDEVLVGRLSESRDTLDEAIDRLRSRGGIRGRITIAIRGEPNAGKSQLINVLADQSVAIVADVAGTTRDAVTFETRLAGHDVMLVDTAGMEDRGDSDSPEEQISRASQRQADRAGDAAMMRLWCVDGSRSDFNAGCEKVSRQASVDRRAGAIDLFVATKSDLSPEDRQVPSGWLRCSALCGDGVSDLITAIEHALATRDVQETGSVIGTAIRCGQSLTDAREAIARAIAMTQAEQGHEFVSAELRLAVESLGEVTGAVYTDDILDRVFGRFCIGK